MVNDNHQYIPLQKFLTTIPSLSIEGSKWNQPFMIEPIDLLLKLLDKRCFRGIFIQRQNPGWKSAFQILSIHSFIRVVCEKQKMIPPAVLVSQSNWFKFISNIKICIWNCEDQLYCHQDFMRWITESPSLWKRVITLGWRYSPHETLVSLYCSMLRLRSHKTTWLDWFMSMSWR